MAIVFVGFAWAQPFSIRQFARLGIYLVGVAVIAKALLPTFAFLTQVVKPRRENNGLGDVTGQAQPSCHIGGKVSDFVEVGLQQVSRSATFATCLQLFG